MTPIRYPQTGLLVVYGAGAHGLVVAEAAEAAGWRMLGFLDDGLKVGARVGHWKVLGESEAGRSSVEVLIAVGDNATREKLAAARIDQGQNLAIVIHPTACISPSATLGAGTFVGPHALVHTEALVGEGAIINSGAIVEHHNRIGPYAHIAPRAALCGRVEVGARTLVGVGAAVRPKVKIGADCVVGAGSAVVKDVPDGRTVVGVPAR